ncbi:hypothetical protein AU381_10310 [Sinorhizobium glycinis]|uniref:Uncharacterized protein n=1 Tax=Sinorhizobium glycinis TaxID=1472378 RepID=A0A178XXE2_9HYPH|nr:hypothetical protein AU381_10310 [Sinorhizobium glycinis]
MEDIGEGGGTVDMQHFALAWRWAQYFSLAPAFPATAEQRSEIVRLASKRIFALFARPAIHKASALA